MDSPVLMIPVRTSYIQRSGKNLSSSANNLVATKFSLFGNHIIGLLHHFSRDLLFYNLVLIATASLASPLTAFTLLLFS